MSIHHHFVRCHHHIIMFLVLFHLHKLLNMNHLQMVMSILNIDNLHYIEFIMCMSLSSHHDPKCCRHHITMCLQDSHRHITLSRDHLLEAIPILNIHMLYYSLRFSMLMNSHRNYLCCRRHNFKNL